jgi:hypothetical protein
MQKCIEKISRLKVTFERILKLKESEEPEEQMSYDQYNKNVSRKTFSTKGSIDFTKSHLHNPIVVNHKSDLDVETGNIQNSENNL